MWECFFFGTKKFSDTSVNTTFKKRKIIERFRFSTICNLIKFDVSL